MTKDNKKLLKYLGIMFLTVILTNKLPYDTYSIIEYIMRPIKFNKTVIFYSGIVPLVLFYIAIKGIFNLKKFEKNSKLLIFLIVVMLIIPAMKLILDYTRSGYHWFMRERLQAVDIVDGKLNLESANNNYTIKLKLELIDFSSGTTSNHFKIRIYLPKTLSEYTRKDFYEIEKDYVTHGGRRKIKIEENIVVQLDNHYDIRDLYNTQWYYEDVKYELYNEKEIVRITDHGLDMY